MTIGNALKQLRHYSYNMYVITSPPEGVAMYCFDPVCLSVCLYVCVCVCVCVTGHYFLVFHLSAIRRDIYLKFIQDTHRVVLNSLKKVKGQGHRDGILLFEGTVISQKLRHIIFFHRHLLGYSIR